VNILIVNSGEKVDAGRWIADCLADTGTSMRIVHRSELVGGFDVDEFDRVCLSGSERSVFEEADWISAQLDFVNHCADRGIPIMGVCFGHQIIARALYGKNALKRRKIPEVGWTEVRFDDHWLFEGFSSPLPAFNFHFDEVILEEVRDFDVVAESDECPVHAIIHKTLPLIAVQFHPEIKPDDGAFEIADRGAVLASFGLDSDDILKRASNERRTYLPEIVRNFAKRLF
jgi:GMP synthase (glutamine-hydrolysing)